MATPSRHRELRRQQVMRDRMLWDEPRIAVRTRKGSSGTCGDREALASGHQRCTGAVIWRSVIRSKICVAKITLVLSRQREEAA